MSSCGPLCWFAVFASQKWRKVLVRHIDHCSMHWLHCWATCWMLQDMDSMEASCIFYFKVGTFTQLEHSKICILSVNETGIVRLTVQHDWIVSLSFRHYPRDLLRQTSADILSLEECHIYIWQSSYFGYCTAQSIHGKKYTTLDRLIANCKMVGNPRNLHSYAARLMLSITYMLAATYSILTWSSLYIPQDFPLLFFIIFLSYPSPPNHGYTNISVMWRQKYGKPINGHFGQYVTPLFTAITPTPVSPLRHSQWIRQRHDPGCRFKNRP